MKRTLVLLAVLVCLLLLCAGSALADDEIEISMANAYCGEDLLFRGYINQEIIGLNEGEPVHISMRDVFDMFPEHSGIYGLLYATEPVTLTANGAEGQQAAGSGVVEFAFPDATECTLTGTGTVYAYFLPVPYMRLSADASLVHEHFDTAYLTETAVGHQHMFILADPHIFVYQDLIPYGGTVYKWSSGVGPLPEKYSQYACSGDNPSPLPFLYDSPVLVQCDGITLEAFQTDTFFARPMVQAVDGEGFEVWRYTDYQLDKAVGERMRETFDACLSVAYEQFLADGLRVDTIIAVMLYEELAEEGVNGVSYSEVIPDRIAHQNYLFLNTAAWEEADDYLYFLFAHEIGHNVHNATLTQNPLDFSGWFSEGFADYFAEKVAERIGMASPRDPYLNEADIEALSFFDQDLVFGIHTPQEFYPVCDDRSVLLHPDDQYAFGLLFMRYLEDVYGEGFFKNVSERFYLDRFKGYEDKYQSRYLTFIYDVDAYFAEIKSGLSEDVYLSYPAYAQTHYLQ